MQDARQIPLLLGHSPDPDDAFMFYAMAEGKIDLRGYTFEHILQDIQTLNQRALGGELHISAVSIHALAYILDRYALLPTGASMGDGYGPMFVTRELAGLEDGADWDSRKRWLSARTIAVPGTMTSAFLAARLFLGEFNYVVVPFDEIFSAVQSGVADVGLLIHEGQLTFASEGFSLVGDLGVWWLEETGLPLPLGGNVIRKDIPLAQQAEISAILRESIAYGLAHRAPAVTHSMPLARGMDEALADKFIGMYVNDLTLDYGDRGRRAISEFLRRGALAGIIPAEPKIEFVP